MHSKTCFLLCIACSCVASFLWYIVGVREVVLCKDAKGKCGMSIHTQSKGVFVCFVLRNSPAALAGLRFGDQILMVSPTAAGCTEWFKALLYVHIKTPSLQSG